MKITVSTILTLEEAIIKYVIFILVIKNLLNYLQIVIMGNTVLQLVVKQLIVTQGQIQI